MKELTDIELMELVAIAVGGEVLLGNSKKRTGPTWESWEWSGPVGYSINGICYRPLISDGDAFRLAVQLMIDQIFSPLDVFVFAPDVKAIAVDYDGDPLAKTRKAIVMAAASIGQRKKDIQ